MSAPTLSERLIACLPGASFEMETLCRLAGVVESRAIATAAVECRARPRLLVNPDFVERHCRRDEHLFLLVMHELWHVILAHTRLYPRPTSAHNIAFDAVVNAGLAREFTGPEYRGFLEGLNPADEFPGLLLRPPAGWPQAPAYRRLGPAGTAGIVRRLYPPPDQPDTAMPLYEELLDLLRRGGITTAARVVLLGDHDHLEHEEHALDDALFGETIRRIVAGWPPPPFPLGGRDMGGDTRGWQAALAPAAADARRVFARILRRTLVHPHDGELRRRRATLDEGTGVGVLPNGRDRLRPARVALGSAGALWTQSAPVAVRLREPPAAAHVYLDVSGSMQDVLPHLCGLLAPYAPRGLARVFQFSTEVLPLPTASLLRGELTTTAGTDIGCVLEHALTTPNLRRVVLLTDGYVGKPPEHLRPRLHDRRLAIHTVLPAESAWTYDLEPISHSLTTLPPLR